MRFMVVAAALLLLAAPVLAQTAGQTHVIAVTEFEGDDAELRAAITDTVTNDLAASSKLRLVERAQIKKAEEELGLAQMGMVDTSNAPELGKMVAANKVVVGSFHVVGAAVSISAHLVDVESGQIDPGMVANVEGNIAGRRGDVFPLAHQLADRFHFRLTGEWLSPELPIDPRSDPLRFLKPGQDSIPVQVSANKGAGATYRYGERLTITFSVEEDCYVHIYNVDAAGTVTPLYPNEWDQGRKAQAGQTYTIPPAGAGWYLNVEGTPGQEAIVAIATKNPVTFEENESVTEFIGKSIKPRLENTSPGEWGTAQVRFYTEIPAASLADVRGKYVYIPSPIAAAAKGIGLGPEAELEKGEEALLLNKYEVAQGHFEAALKAVPDLLPAMNGLGRAWFFQGENQMALTYFQQALAQAEKSAAGDEVIGGIVFNLAMTHYAMSDHEPCRESLREYLDLDTDPNSDLRRQAQALLDSLPNDTG